VRYRVASLAVLLVTCVWIQGYLFSLWRPLGVVPNVLLLVVLLAGLARTGTETVAMAVAGGLLLDFISGADFGLRMAFYSALALTVLASRRAGADYENFWVLMSVTVIGSIVYNLGVLVGLSDGLVDQPWGLILSTITKEVAINLLMMLVLRSALIKLFKARRLAVLAEG
jgi:rod shape-determining protein MreD